MKLNDSSFAGSRVLFIFLLVVLGSSAPRVWSQLGRPSPPVMPGREGLKKVDYVHNDQKYQFWIIGGEVRRVMQDGKPLLMVNAGTVMAFPGVDLKAAAAAQDAYNAYQAERQPAAPASAASAPAKTGLTVDGVVAMLEAGVSEDIITEKIRKNGQAFDLSTDDIVRLKKAKASDGLMKAMMEGPPASVAASAPQSASPGTQAATTPTDAAPGGSVAEKPKKKGFFSSIGQSVNDTMHGRTVIDKIGLRNILPQWDPERPLAEQFPHVAITVLYAPMGWMDPYETDKSAAGTSVLPSCFKLKAVVWSDATHSKTIDSFDWCSNHDLMMPQLEPTYIYSLAARRPETSYRTGINRTDGPAPPSTLLPADRSTLDMEAATNPEARSVDLNLDAHSRIALMFANVRKDLGETLTADGDARVWMVSIKKAAGPSLF